MKRIHILLILAWIGSVLCAQYVTPWGIGPLAVSPGQQSGATRISSLSIGGILPTVSQSDLLSVGLQQTGLDVFIPVWDTLDIEELGEFSVYDESPIGYFLESSALGPTARFVITPDNRTMGLYSWDETKHLFLFTPDLSKREFCDTLTFHAIAGTDTITSVIHFSYIPRLPSEDHALGLKNLSSGDDDLSNGVTSAYEKADSSLHIAGRIVIFDAASDDHGICQYSAQGNSDTRFDTIKHIILYADSLYIKEALRFPGANVTVYARWLVFENMFSCINTKPYSTAIINNGSVPSEDGKPGGNIFLFTGDIHMGPGKHFILNGANGQDVTTGSGQPPGEGGQGGKLVSPVFISHMNYSLIPGRNGNGGQQYVYAAKGQFIKTEWNPAIWVHARNIQPDIQNLRMQYMENNLEYVRNRCEYLDGLLTLKFGENPTAGNSDDADLLNARNEIREMRARLNKQLDYYGNPVGWVPLLSFEVYKGVFESEVDNAFNLMFLSYLINKSDANIAQAKNGMLKTRTSMINEVTALQGNLNANIQRLETYENLYELLETKVDSLRNEMKELEERLLKEAEKNAEKARKMAIIKSVASVGGSILSMIPHPACQIAGQGLSIVSKLDLEDPFSMENAGTLLQASVDALGSYKNYKSAAIDKMGTDQKLKDLTGITQSEIDDIDSGLDKWNSVNSAIGGMLSYANSFNESTSLLQVSDEMVQAELDKLKAASTEYKNLMLKIETTVYEKQEMQEKIMFTMNCISRDLNRVAENRMAIQALTKSIQDQSGKRDIRAKQYANNLEKRAFERLQNYHYLMSRAFEYRTLMPWNQPLNLESVRNAMLSYVLSLSDTATNVTVPKEQFDAIKGIYMDQLSEIADSILANFETGGFTKNRTTSFELSKEELEMLNNGELFLVNPYERMLFGLDKENVRIKNIGVVKCVLDDGTTLTGTLDEVGKKSSQADAPFEIIIKHSGYSKLQSNGIIYYFNHNKVGSRKFEWRSNIDITGNKISQDKISNTDKSLLHSLISNLSDSHLTFCSEPSAWADLSLERISGGETRKIVSMILEINFDYKVLSDDIKILQVETEGEVDPYYLLSTEDLNGFRDGKGDFYRTYGEATVVAITAQERYGNQKFVRWDKVSLSGIGGRTTLTNSTTAGIITTSHTHLIAVYESTDSLWITTKGDHTFSKGGTLSVNWDQNMDHDVKIDLYSDGFFVASISDSVMGKTFNWQVPLNLELPSHGSGIFKVKVTSRLDNSIFDWSGNFHLVGTGVEEQKAGDSRNSLLIHPNPAKDVIWIELEGMENPGEASWSVYSLNGQLISSGKFFFWNKDQKNSLYLDNLSQGTYLLNIHMGKRDWIGKFMIE